LQQKAKRRKKKQNGTRKSKMSQEKAKCPKKKQNVPRSSKT
jgi:hypothetical protein